MIKKIVNSCDLEAYVLTRLAGNAVIRRRSRSFLLVALVLLAFDNTVAAQRGERGIHTLYGDVKTEGAETADAKKPLSFELVLYNLNGNVVGRHTVPSNGRYRFMDLQNGHYDVAVVVENTEVARVRVYVNSPYKSDFRQDIALEWKGPTSTASKPASISAEDYYKRSSDNQKLFDKAQAATDKKKYAEASTLLNQILAADPNDFQAWTELGTLNLAQQNLSEAEKAYLRAVEARPKFFLALMNLGRLRVAQKKYEEALSPLTLALEIKPASANLNFLLGEAYLQVKKGSKAVVHFYQSLKLDPVGMAEAHLRVATLYNAAGMKDKAAMEYEEFLKKKPDFSDKKKLEQYISQNKKP